MLKDVIVGLYFNGSSIKYVVLNILHLVPFGTGETKTAHFKRCQRIVEQTLTKCYNEGEFNT